MTSIISDSEIIRRLLLAAVLGALLGLERELRQKSAGLRTNILIAVGSALFTIASIVLAPAGADPTRIAAQIVTGVGFLGAGAIMRTGEHVQGLTTAAAVWVNAAVGVAAGGGHYHLAFLGAAVTLLVLIVLPPIEGFIDRRFARKPGWHPDDAEITRPAPPDGQDRSVGHTLRPPG